jgi:REP element-mobilizing transposase RayT
VTIRIQTILDQHYHVYNRGVEKRDVFNDEFDYQRFLLLLLLSNDQLSVDVSQSVRDYSIPELIKKDRSPIVFIHAFSLLPNHYHLLLTPATDGGISKFMQKVATGYTMYFNKKNERSGALFQGKYKIKHAEEGRYLKYLFEYIHLNKIREEFDSLKTDQVLNLIKKAEKSPWTSLSVYSGLESGRLSEAVLEKSLFFELHDSYKQHYLSICSWKESEQNLNDLEEGSTFLKIE